VREVAERAKENGHGGVFARHDDHHDGQERIHGEKLKAKKAAGSPAGDWLVLGPGDVATRRS
jgi:hypothetical protein